MSRLARFTPLARAVGMVWTISPGLAGAATLLLLVDLVLGLGLIYLLKLLVDAMGASAGAEGGNAPNLAALLWITAGVSIFAAVSRAMASLVSEHLGQTVSDRVDARLNCKVSTADLERLESPEHYDLTARALLAGGSRPAQTVSNLFMVAQHGFMLAGMGALLVTIHWALVALLLVALVPGTLIRLRQSRILHDWQVLRTRLERHVYYLRWLLTEKSGAKEVRVFGLAGILAARFDAIRDQLRGEKLRISGTRMLIELSITLGVTVALFLVIAWLASRAVSGSGSYGELVLFLMVFMRGQGAIQALKSSLAALFDDHLYLRALFKFLDHDNKVLDPVAPAPVPRARGLAVREVSFRYPGTDALVLDRVSLSIPPGKVVAVVGANGSGKSTLIKLLCRFYDPDHGAVFWGTLDIREFRQAEYRRRVGVLFQDFVCYQTDLVENIRMGDVALDRDSRHIRESGRAALVDDYADQLPQGYETLLGRVLEEGKELSHGQWQRLALARALVSDSDLLILDEPTSAMDPEAEARIFGRFREMLAGRSALVISHRLSIVRQADYIYMMEHGRVVEEGTHEELLRKGAKYHDLFMAQARAYRLDPDPTASYDA